MLQFDRHRRLRTSAAMRDLVRETQLLLRKHRQIHDNELL